MQHKNINTCRGKFVNYFNFIEGCNFVIKIKTKKL